MSLTIVVWCLLFMALTVGAMKRPVWGVALYFLTYFGEPALWWWGDPIESIRWNLIGSVIAITSVLIHNPPRFRKLSDAWMEILLGLMVLNATFVHLFLADNPAVSAGPYDILTKSAVLTFLIRHAIRTEPDFMVMLLTLTIAVGHLGYEVKVNDAGRIVKGRLEQVGPSAARGSNQLASLLTAVLPMVGTIGLVGKGTRRWIAVASAPFAVNTFLLCSCRAAFLGLIVAAPVYLVLSPARTRRLALCVILLGAVGVGMLLRDDRIIERFYTIFVGEEQRDASAAHRLDYWKAGLAMVKDYPLGEGGDGFKVVHGKKYRVQYGSLSEARAVHNGFINEACEWGIQGAALRIALMVIGTWIAISTARQYSKRGQPGTALIGASFAAGMAGYLVTCMFGDRLDAEWGLWLVALSAAYRDLYQSGQGVSQQNSYRIYLVQPAPSARPEVSMA